MCEILYNLNIFPQNNSFFSRSKYPQHDGDQRSLNKDKL